MKGQLRTWWGMIWDLLEDGLEVTDAEEHCHSI